MVSQGIVARDVSASQGEHASKRELKRDPPLKGRKRGVTPNSLDDARRVAEGGEQIGHLRLDLREGTLAGLAGLDTLS